MSMSILREETEALEFIIEFIYERCRIRLHSGKEALIRARLGKRMRHHGFNHLAEYCRYLRTEADEEELTLLVDALTTNFTHFFREEDHFQFLVNKALPELTTGATKEFQVWSAACASGEEPYTIAFYLAEHFSLAGPWNWRVIASDISTKALEQARLGIYTEDRVKTVRPDWLRRYFQQGVGRWAGHYRVKRVIAERIDFRQCNLIAPYNFDRPFQVIFCRNVMIYFDRPTQEHLVNGLCRFLVPKGYLLIGHSESLHGLKVPVRCLRPSIYQKQAT
jgi:chemotaxis protein methyltransferase CheR